MFSVSLMVITKKKPVVETQMIRIKESKHNTIKKSSNHKGRQPEEKRNYKTVRKEFFLHGDSLRFCLSVIFFFLSEWINLPDQKTQVG